MLSGGEHTVKGYQDGTVGNKAVVEVNLRNSLSLHWVMGVGKSWIAWPFLDWLDASGVNMVSRKLQILSSKDRLSWVDDDAMVLVNKQGLHAQRCCWWSSSN